MIVLDGNGVRVTGVTSADFNFVYVLIGDYLWRFSPFTGKLATSERGFVYIGQSCSGDKYWNGPADGVFSQYVALDDSRSTAYTWDVSQSPVQLASDDSVSQEFGGNCTTVTWSQAYEATEESLWRIKEVSPIPSDLPGPFTFSAQY